MAAFSGTSIGYRLRRVSSLAMATLADDLATLELRITEASVIYQIAENPKATSSHIGQVLGIQRANMTPLISTLVKRDYIHADRKDGRSQSLTLTSDGQAVFKKIKKIIESHDQNFFFALSATERKDLMNILNKVWDSQTAEQ